MNNHNVEESLNQQIIQLTSRKKEFKERIIYLQEFRQKQYNIIEFQERVIKRKYDLTKIKDETIKDLIRKKRRILEKLNHLEEENTELKKENRVLKRNKCCHENEC